MESKQQILELSPKSSASVSNHKTSTNIEAFVGSSPSLIIHSHNLEPYLCRDGNLTLHLLQADLDNTISLMLKMQKEKRQCLSSAAPVRSVYSSAFKTSKKTLDILIWAVCFRIWKGLSASACPRHPIAPAWAKALFPFNVTLQRTFIPLASTFGQAAPWISASPPGRSRTSAGRQGRDWQGGVREGRG